MGWPWVDLLDTRAESALKKVRSKFHTKILVESALKIPYYNPSGKCPQKFHTIILLENALKN